MNYGAIGMVIGHEIIHGFDDQGRKFDAHGNLRDWWTAEDAKQYDERGKCISDEYTQEVPEAGPGVKQNGLLTQGEDTADNGGIHLALMALEAASEEAGQIARRERSGRLDLSASASSSRMPTRGAPACGLQIARLIVTTDPHSLPDFPHRQCGSNMPEFAKAFGCKAGQKMVRANACRVW